MEPRPGWLATRHRCKASRCRKWPQTTAAVFSLSIKYVVCREQKQNQIWNSRLLILEMVPPTLFAPALGGLLSPAEIKYSKAMSVPTIQFFILWWSYPCKRQSAELSRCRRAVLLSFIQLHLSKVWILCPLSPKNQGSFTVLTFECCY